MHHSLRDNFVCCCAAPHQRQGHRAKVVHLDDIGYVFLGVVLMLVPDGLQRTFYVMGCSSVQLRYDMKHKLLRESCSAVQFIEIIVVLILLCVFSFQTNQAMALNQAGAVPQASKCHEDTSPLRCVVV